MNITNENPTPANPIQVADKIFMVIELLAQEGSMGLIEISKSLSLNKTTAHRILNSLLYMGYVIQNSSNSKYRLSYKICNLSNQILSKLDVIKLVRPHLQRLADLCQETVHLVQLEGTEAVYIDKIESTDNSIRLVSQLGKRLPLYSSGVGKAILANMSEQEVKRIWDASAIERFTAYTITDFNVLLNALSEVRANGYAIDNQENEVGIRCIAASLESPQQDSSYAFSISAPIYRMPDSKVAELSAYVLETQRNITLTFDMP